MNFLRILATLFVWISLPSAAFAQTYPSKPVRLVVPFALGGGVDTTVRMVAPKLSEAWGQPVVVDNRLGAGGTVGSVIVAKSAADGYTLLAHSMAYVVSAALRTSLPYDPSKDFVAIAPLTRQAYVLVVGNRGGIKTVGDLITAAKSRPGELKFTSNGIGSGTHLMAEKFNVEAGIKMVHIPAKGAGAANDEVIAGRVMYRFSSIAAVLPHIREGRLVVLGVSSAERVRTMPEIPSVSEAGLPGFVFAPWYGVWAPAGAPDAVVDKIAKDIARALAAPDVRERLTKGGAETMSMTPAEFARFVRGEAETVARIARAAGIKPQ